MRPNQRVRAGLRAETVEIRRCVDDVVPVAAELFEKVGAFCPVANSLINAARSIFMATWM
jgi:hypothetical protein